MIKTVKPGNVFRILAIDNTGTVKLLHAHQFPFHWSVTKNFWGKNDERKDKRRTEKRPYRGG